MKALLELVPFLNGYPLALRAVMLALPPLYVLVFVLLYVLAPPPVVSIETLRRLAGLGPDALGLDITVRNATSAVANITAADIQLYSGAKPEGGLASALTVSATYKVEKTEQAAVVVSDQDKTQHEAMVTRPYAGNPFTRTTLALAQQVKAGEIDRFIVLLRGREIVLPAHDVVEVKLDYNGTKETAPGVLKLR